MSVLHINIPSYMNQPKLIVYKYNRSHYLPVKHSIKLFFDDISDRSDGFIKFFNKTKKRSIPSLVEYINTIDDVVTYYGGKVHPKTNFCTLSQFVFLFKTCYRAYEDFRIKKQLTSLESYTEYLLDVKSTDAEPTILERIAKSIHEDNKRQAIDELKRSDLEIKRIALWLKEEQI